ncbi:hypothetical protein Lal_00041716 [Lupinus albus]|nr:hypothetical protein Lal_00041716 [Lupinus albus]
MVSELFSAANKMTPFRAHGGPDRRELLFLFGFDDLVASMAANSLKSAAMPSIYQVLLVFNEPIIGAITVCKHKK